MANELPTLVEHQVDGEAQVRLVDETKAPINGANPLPVSGTVTATVPGVAMDATLREDAETAVDILWNAEDGTHEVEVPLPASWVNCRVDLTGTWALNSLAPGAATFQLIVSHTHGFTPGDNSCRYTSAATGALAQLADPIPYTPGQFYVGATPKLYARPIPNAGTITGAAQIMVRRHR